jgi:DNA-directed RNA polymerase subunit beta
MSAAKTKKPSNKAPKNLKPIKIAKHVPIQRHATPANSVESFTGRKRVRRSFGRKIREVAQMPNLIEVQRDSYEQFLQMDIPPTERAKCQGLHKCSPKYSRSRTSPTRPKSTT